VSAPAMRASAAYCLILAPQLRKIAPRTRVFAGVVPIDLIRGWFLGVRGWRLLLGPGLLQVSGRRHRPESL
jgi:hypothetical protein